MKQLRGQSASLEHCVVSSGFEQESWPVDMLESNLSSRAKQHFMLSVPVFARL